MKEPGQSTTWNKRSSAEFAVDGDPKTFSRTKQGVGEYWIAKFPSSSHITKVKILNRKDACGDRLANTKVYVGGKYFGTLPEETKSG